MSECRKDEITELVLGKNECFTTQPGVGCSLLWYPAAAVAVEIEIDSCYVAAPKFLIISPYNSQHIVPYSR